MSKLRAELDAKLKKAVKEMGLDQCKKCTCKGHAAACYNQDCTQHKTWYALHLKMMVETATIARVTAEKARDEAYAARDRAEAELAAYKPVVGRVAKVYEQLWEILNEVRETRGLSFRNPVGKHKSWEGRTCRECCFVGRKYDGKSYVCSVKKGGSRVAADGPACSLFSHGSKKDLLK